MDKETFKEQENAVKEVLNKAISNYKVERNAFYKLKYERLKTFIYEKAEIMKDTFPDDKDDFGNGVKEVFRKLIEVIEEEIEK